MAKSYFHDGADWRELVRGEQGEQGPVGPRGPQGIQGPMGTLELIGDNPAITVDTSVGTRVFVGDTMIHGDTGWRDVNNDFLNGWTAGQAFLKRVNDTVFFQATFLNPNDSDSVYFYQFPPGFRVNTSTDRVPLLANSGQSADAPSVVRVVYNGQVRVGTIGETLHIMGTFMTRQNWPTALPGVPS